MAFRILTMATGNDDDDYDSIYLSILSVCLSIRLSVCFVYPYLPPPTPSLSLSLSEQMILCNILQGPLIPPRLSPHTAIQGGGGDMWPNAYSPAGRPAQCRLNASSTAKRLGGGREKDDLAVFSERHLGVAVYGVLLTSKAIEYPVKGSWLLSHSGKSIVTASFPCFLIHTIWEFLREFMG